MKAKNSRFLIFQNLTNTFPFKMTKLVFTSLPRLRIAAFNDPTGGAGVKLDG